MRNFRSCLQSLWRRMRHVRPKLALSVGIGLLSVSASLGFVWASKRVVDIATGNIDASFGRAVALMAGIMLCEILFRTVERWWNGYITVDTQNRLRASLFGRVMCSVWQGREKMHSGDTVNRLEEDIRVGVDFICSTVPECIVTLVQLLSAAAFLFVLSPSLAWILLLIMPAALLGSRLFFRRMRHITGQIRAGDSAVQGFMQENLQHRMLIRTLSGTQGVLRKLDALQAYVRQRTVSRLGYGAVSRLFISAGFAAGYAVAFFWGAFGLKDGTVTYGMMVAFLQLVSRVQRPMADITRHIPSFIRALASEERLMELEELEQEEEEEPVRFKGAPGLRVSGLGYRYPDAVRPVLEGLDFDFKPGSLTVVTGPTGAGKSTLTRILLGLLKPVSGRVELYPAEGDSTPAAAPGPGTRCNFMYVPQGNSLMSGTVRGNLLLADPQADDARLKEVLHIAAADFVFSLPQGLDTPCAEIGGGLSEGQAQRIAIARALLRPGGILILDEATSALDAGTEERLLEMMAGRYKGLKTIICITHREAVSRLADVELAIPDILHKEKVWQRLAAG
ncbi:MAG: ABC transporter ATP-binding protein [Bacteroidales bacterium]|nr:ABC transporter ATP-binding protein [Bacteroidales bacterium]